MPPRILIAGIGNIFLGDDAFGVEVVQKLAQRAWPENVRVVDFGIRGFDLCMALLEDIDLVILVDAAPRGGPPGTLYVIEPDHALRDDLAADPPLLDPHSLDPVKVLRMVKTMGDGPRRVLVLGCEPAIVGSDLDWDVKPGLSEPVQQALDRAVELVESLICEAHLGSSRPGGEMSQDRLSWFKRSPA
jgi:hydrogenase maturation protease